jgi:uncharacterized ParB-like nuclease family protein
MSTAAAAKLNIQEMALRAITVDHDLQSRVETIMEVVKEYADAIIAGSIFPPVVVFFDGHDIYLADGFHRYAAHLRAGQNSIRAEVREGTRRDAALYSAGANARMGMRPTADDKRKAVRMLLADPEWFNWSDAEIGRRCGANKSLVSNVRCEWCTEQNVPLPLEVVRSDGKISRRPRPGGGVLRTQYTKCGTVEYLASINGRRHYLGVDMAAAAAKLELLKSKHAISLCQYNDMNDLSRLLWRRLISGQVIDGRYYKVPEGIVGDGWVCCLADLAASKNTFKTTYQAIGQVLTLRQLEAPGARAIVACDHPSAVGEFSKIVEACRPLGVEFLTLDEIVAEFVTEEAVGTVADA